MTFLVTIDEPAGEVKDLEHHIGSLHWQPPVILREICTPMMPPGAHITDRSRISPVLPRPLSGRLLSSQALANGEGRGADSFVGKRLPARASYNSCVSIDCFSCKIMPFFNFSHRLLQVILFSMTTGLYTHIRIKSKAGRPSRAALPR